MDIEHIMFNVCLLRTDLCNESEILVEIFYNHLDIDWLRGLSCVTVARVLQTIEFPVFQSRRSPMVYEASSVPLKV